MIEKMKEKFLLTDEARETMYKDAVAYFGFNVEDLNKLNLKNLDYSYRCRYIKDEDGKTKSKIIDRGFLGVPVSKTGFADGMDIVPCFFYGKATIGFVVVDSVIYANKNLCDSSDFMMLLYNFIKHYESIYSFGGFVDSLHTGERPQREAKDLDLEKIKTIDELDADLGF